MAQKIGRGVCNGLYLAVLIPDAVAEAEEDIHAHHGPGMYLSRWNALLDSTLISPVSISGPVRRGWEVKGELDGKGLKTSSVLQSSKGGKTSNGVSIANGLGDAQDRKERKRDGLEEDKMVVVWEAMRDGWVGVCRGLEVMGSD